MVSPKIPKPTRATGVAGSASPRKKAAGKKVAGKGKPPRKKGAAPKKATPTGKALTADERKIAITLLKNKKVVITTTPLPVGLKDALKVVAKARGVTLRVLMVTTLRAEVDRELGR